MLLKDRVFYGALVFFLIVISVGYYIQYRNNKKWRSSFKIDEEIDSTLSIYNREIRINVNTANKDVLIHIPGIGEKLALSILRCRDSMGGFDTYEDLLLVRGIGKKKLESIKKYIKLK